MRHLSSSTSSSEPGWYSTGSAPWATSTHGPPSRYCTASSAAMSWLLATRVKVRFSSSRPRLSPTTSGTICRARRPILNNAMAASVSPYAASSAMASIVSGTGSTHPSYVETRRVPTRRASKTSGCAGASGGVRRHDRGKHALEAVSDRQRGQDLALLLGPLGQGRTPRGGAQPLVRGAVVTVVVERAVTHLVERLLGLEDPLGVQREPAAVRHEVGAERVAHQLGAAGRLRSGERRV